MVSSNEPTTFLDLPLELRLEIYSYLIRPSPPHERILSIRTECPERYQKRQRISPRIRKPYFVMGGRLRSQAQKTSYTLSPTPSSSRYGQASGPPPELHPQILGTCRKIHAEASNMLYGSHTFDFSSDVESVVPFLSDLTPVSRRNIRHVNLVKRALPYTKDFDACEWGEVCGYLAAECELEKLGLQVFGGKVPQQQEHGWQGPNYMNFANVLVPSVGGPGDMILDEPDSKATKGFQKGDFGLISRFEGMEWVRQLCAIKNLRNLDVGAIWEVCPPPCSNALAFFISFSESIEDGFAEFLRENMVAGAA